MTEKTQCFFYNKRQARLENLSVIEFDEHGVSCLHGKCVDAKILGGVYERSHITDSRMCKFNQYMQFSSHSSNHIVPTNKQSDYNSASHFCCIVWMMCKCLRNWAFTTNKLATTCCINIQNQTAPQLIVTASSLYSPSSKAIRMVHYGKEVSSIYYVRILEVTISSPLYETCLASSYNMSMKGQT